MNDLLTPERKDFWGKAPKVAFVGDINLGRRTHFRWDKMGSKSLIDVPELERADCVIGNLECVVSLLGQQGKEKGEGGPFYYRARPEMLELLTDKEFRLVFTANNHSCDYGAEALLDQKKWLSLAGIQSVGSGRDLEEAFEPVFLSVGGARVAFFNVDATQARFRARFNSGGTAYLPLGNCEEWKKVLAPRISVARQIASHVFIGVHWGRNWEVEPSPEQVRIGHTLIDAGADAVLGTSAHCLQGVEVYKGRVIVHDAGNFLFDSTKQPRASGVFTLFLGDEGVLGLRFVPLVSEYARVRQLNSSAARRPARNFLERCRTLGAHGEIDEQGHVYIMAAGKGLSSGTHRLNYATRLRELGWLVSKLPPTCKFLGYTMGSIRLLALRMSPCILERRRTVEITSYWELVEPVEENLRLDFQLVSVSGEMPNFGIGMDHDPCDWLCPTSYWEQGVIYRDYYHLRPPPLEKMKTGEMRIQIQVINDQEIVAALSLTAGVEIRL